MAEMLAGTCVVSLCGTHTHSATEVFCPEHWRLVPREQRQELIRLRDVNSRTSKFSKPYALAIAKAVLTLEQPV